jgi:hypothetical protein
MGPCPKCGDTGKTSTVHIQDTMPLGDSVISRHVQTNADKPDFNKYKEWLKKDHEKEITAYDTTYYETVSNKIKLEFEKSKLWNNLINRLKTYNDEYYLKTQGDQLLTNRESVPILYIKSYDSFFLKTYRKNVSENSKWPDPPNVGWILPDDWYLSINDIIRTELVVKYLDGVEFIIEKLAMLCKEFKSTCRIDYEAKEEGYYAVHIYPKQKVEIPMRDWNTRKVDVDIEIQITTQLQENIRKLLHKYYEGRRTKERQEDIKWQWDYRSDEFSTNYLGHILHYMEGMIMEIRDKQTKGKVKI